ncbi:unnamed protein product [Closterium sp. NIES-54]
MRRKVPVGTSSLRPHVQVNNYGRINSPGDDIRMAMAKNTRKARTSTAASGASCDGDDGDEEHGDDGDEEQGDDVEEDWPENGHDGNASEDEIAPADNDEDEWWNRLVGSEDEVEEWRAGDSDNDEGADADGEPAEAAAHATQATVDANAEAGDEADAEARTEEEAEADADAVAPADVAAIADSDVDAVAEADADAAEGGADAVLFDGENSDDDPWNITGDDDVPLLTRRLRHRLQSKPKRARLVLSDDDSPGEERQPRFTAADKGKSAVAEASAKATVRCRTSHKKWKNDGDPGSSMGVAKKKKKKKTANKDDIVVNKALGSDDDYAEAAGLIPSFPEKAKPKDPTLHNPNSHPPSPRSKDSKKRRRGWTVREKLKWARRYHELGYLKKTSVESTASIACIRRWCAEAAAGVYKGAANCRKWMHGGGRHAHYPDMEAALYRYICLQRANGVAISVKDTQKWSREWMKKHHPSKNWNASSHWSQRFRDRWNMVMRVKTKVGQQLSAVPKKVIIEAFHHCGISSKLDGTKNHLVMSHLRARSTTDVSKDMCLGGTTGDNTRLLGQALEEEEDEMQAEGVREVAVASGLDVLYQETPNYRGAATEADRMIEPREMARHA